MAFKKGHDLSKGRPKGVSNKVNAEIREVIQKCVNWINEPERFNKIMSDVAENNPSILINFLAKVAPKDLNIEIGEKQENPVLAQITAMRQAIEDKHKIIEIKAESAK